MKTLLSYLNNNVEELLFKHAVFSTRKSETFIWITLSPETTILTPRTMTQFLSTQLALKEHAVGFWGCSGSAASQIEMTKIDVGNDMKGSFIPDLGNLCHYEISQLLSKAIEQVFSLNSSNFLSLNSVSGLRVTRGDNNLDTCYQYAVLDEEKDKLLNVKVYEKTLDLIGRDGLQMVGSRLGNILGCKG